MYIVQVNSENAQDGCYCKSFTTLGDEVREFVKASAASFREFNKTLKCKATIMKSGDVLSNARVLEC